MPYKPFAYDPLQQLANTAEQTGRAEAGRIPFVLSVLWNGSMRASFQIVGTVPADQLGL